MAAVNAVSSALLPTRDKPLKIDIYNNLTDRQVDALVTGCRIASEQSRSPFTSRFFSNHVLLVLSKSVQKMVLQTASEQNEEVFASPGLKILAAPWNFAFCTKIERNTKPTQWSYDVDDASMCLHRHIQKHGGGGVFVHEIRRWAHMFNITIEDSALREVDECYRQRFGRAAIEF